MKVRVLFREVRNFNLKGKIGWRMFINFITGGERGIRTPGTKNVRQFSKLLVSATHPPLLFLRGKYTIQKAPKKVCLTLLILKYF